MSLSVCLLTRNDEQTIARAIRSVRDVADEVLVADTESADRTADVAAAEGARVSLFRWEDDFAAGRNHLLEQATGDWVLLLDAKEHLDPQSMGALRQAIRRPDAFGFTVRVRHVDAAGRPILGDTADLRLMRRRPDVRFVGRLHPALEQSTVDAVKREGLAVEACDVLLLHHPQAGGATESKLRWTARLLALELRDRPGQLHYLIEQGRTLLMLKDPRGHAAMAAAAEAVAKAHDAARPPSLKVQVLLQHLLTTDAAHVPPALSREAARELAMRWFPQSPSLLWTLAEQSFRAGDYAGAATLLKRLVDLGRSRTFDPSQSFSLEIVGEQALLNLGACYIKLGRFPEARSCFLQIAPGGEFGHAASAQLDALHRAGH